MEEVTEIGDELKAVRAEIEKLKALKKLCSLGDMQDDVSFGVSGRPLASFLEIFVPFLYLGKWFSIVIEILFPGSILEETDRIFIVVTVIVVSSVLCRLEYYFDQGGSKAGSSGSLDFRDIYISIVLFQAAYVWIKFRDVIPRGAVYHRRDSNKCEPRIKFPKMKAVGVESKRVPLGLYDTFAEAEVAYRIAAFYCNKPKHSLGRLDLGGGASFSIPTLSLDPSLDYEEKVKQVRDQVLKAYAEFEEKKLARNLPPRVPELASEMSVGESQLLATSPIQQLPQPLNSGVDSAMQGQGSQLAPSIHHGDDFNNPGSLLLLLAKTQHELLEAKRQNECLKAQLSRMEVENNQLKQRNVEGLSNEQIMQLQSQLQPLHQEPDFDLDLDLFLSMEHEELLAT